MAIYFDLSSIFTSQGDERFWDQYHGVQHGNFNHEYLPAIQLTPSLRLVPALVDRLWHTDADLFITTISGRFSLPITYFIARLRRKRFVLWTGIWKHPETIFHRLSFPLLRYIYIHSDAIVTYGIHIRDYLLNIGVSSERIFVAPHAVDNAQYNQVMSPAARDSLRKLHDLVGRKVVLYVGRLDDSKGLLQLVEAVALISDIQPVLVLVGSGWLREQITTSSANAGVESRFIGYVPTSELYRYYALADVFVLPSVTTRLGKEPWGLVVNEAMNQGAPVIVTDAVGAAPGGLVRNGETGLIVPEGDIDALGTALRLMLTDVDYAQRIGESGKLEVAFWNNDRMTEGFVQAAEFAMSHSNGR